MRFIDHLRRDKNSFIAQNAVEVLDGIPVIVADNVCNYFFAENDKEYWYPYDFPNLTPPFDEFWIETYAPKMSISKEKGMHSWSQYNASMWGLYCVGTTYTKENRYLSGLHEQELFKAIIKKMLNELAQKNDESQKHVSLLAAGIFANDGEWELVREALPVVNDVHFSLEMWLYLRMPPGMTIYGEILREETNLGPLWYYRNELNARGEVLYITGKEEVLGMELTMRDGEKWIDALQEATGGKRIELSTQLRNMLLPFAQVGYMTLSFLHCKNVALEEHKPEYHHVRNKSAKRRGETGYQPAIFKTLNIYPMSPASGQKTDVGSNQSASSTHKRMHIARGHFRNYLEGAGLFGKYHGLYWVPSHVRGSKESGVVSKDYKISTKHVKEATSNEE